MIEWLMMVSCFRPLACRIQPHRCPHRALPSHCTLAGTGPESNNGLLPHRRRMAKLRRQPKLCGHDATTLLELIDWLTWFNMQKKSYSTHFLTVRQLVEIRRGTHLLEVVNEELGVKPLQGPTWHSTAQHNSDNIWFKSGSNLVQIWFNMFNPARPRKV